MRIVIIGAGIIGLTSAWYLVKAGHEVTIIDQNTDSAEGASFANGGLLSVGQSAPSSVPRLPKKALKQIWKKNSPMKVKPDFSTHQIRWLLQFLKQCTAKNYAINLHRMINIANLTRQCFHALQKEANIECELRSGGILQLCENEQQWQAAQQQSEKLKQLNIKTELLTVEQLYEVEPNLRNSKKTLVGGLHFVSEECGDCLKFARGLANKLTERGVKFDYGVTVKQILTNKDLVESIITDKTTYKADAYVIATGAETYQLLKEIVYIPVYPVKGYSLTLPITNTSKAPQYAMMDMSSAVAITRLDNRVRVAGYGEVVGFDKTVDNEHVNSLKDIFASWFPESTDLTQPNPWVGFRPMTPDGTPIISKTPINNLYVNVGHGIYGWTMSCGSGQMLADIIDNKVSETEVADYSLNRYK